MSKTRKIPNNPRTFRTRGIAMDDVRMGRLLELATGASRSVAFVVREAVDDYLSRGRTPTVATKKPKPRRRRVPARSTANRNGPRPPPTNLPAAPSQPTAPRQRRPAKRTAVSATTPPTNLPVAEASTAAASQPAAPRQRRPAKRTAVSATTPPYDLPVAVVR